MKNAILASSSSVHGSGYLEYIQEELIELFHGVSEVLFIPYARPGGISHTAYTKIAHKGLGFLGIAVKGIHEFENPKDAIQTAEAIFVGGGNTFVLVNNLYENDLFDVLRNTVEKGVPYLGTSAGTNIFGISMQTTNDMPIVMPKSMETLDLIPFNINAHFVEADKNSTHKGETRETRIKEFHYYNDTPVLGLKEGSWLQLQNGEIILKGNKKALLFEKNKKAQYFKSESDLSFLY